MAPLYTLGALGAALALSACAGTPPPATAPQAAAAPDLQAGDEAEPSEPADDGPIRLDGANAHQAARFLADIYRIDVVAAAPGDELRALAIADRGPEHALDTIADAAGLTLTTLYAETEPLYVLGARELTDPAPVAGTAVDLDLEAVSAGNLLLLVRDLEGISAHGTVSGDVTMRVRQRPALEVLAAILGLAGADWSLDDRILEIGHAELPSAGSSAEAPRCEETYIVTAAPCVDIDALRLIGVADLDDAPARALLLAPDRAHVVVRGDTVGALDPDAPSSPWRVDEILADRVTLSRGSTDGDEGVVLRLSTEAEARAPAR